jgi:hypothetical protein
MPDRPSTKWKRTKELMQTRQDAADALTAFRHSIPGTDAWHQALLQCAATLESFLYTTSTEQQLEELRARFPGLPDPLQPELITPFSRSVAAK